MTFPVATRPTTTVVRRWDPFRQMEDVYDRMNELMRGFMGDGGAMAPADIEETDDAYLIELDLPGIKPGDVNVEMRDSDLRISGEIKERQRTGVLRRQARRTGRFEHVVTLPSDIDPNQVEARLSNGVLTVRVAKAAASQPRRVEIKSNG